MLHTLLLSALPALGSVSAPEGEPPTPPPAAVAAAGLRAEALAALRTPLPAGLEEAEQADARVDRAVDAAAILGESSEIARRLEEAAHAAYPHVDTTPRAASLLLDLVTDAAVRDLRFEPVFETALPVGFPYPVPAGEIQVVAYPVYRLARSEMDRGRTNGAFFRLFRHIQSNDIAMTSPVEMTMDRERMLDMAFLYRAPEMTGAVTQERVAIEDVEPMTVVSMGIGGDWNGSGQDQALAALEAWLLRNAASWKRTGSTRLMAYNGPSVPRSKQFFEVQIPIAPAGGPADGSN